MSTTTRFAMSLARSLATSFAMRFAMRFAMSLTVRFAVRFAATFATENIALISCFFVYTFCKVHFGTEPLLR